MSESPKNIDSEDLVTSLHKPFRPQQVYAGEQITAVIEMEGGDSVELQVWRMSPLGVELMSPTRLDIKRGTSLKLFLKIGAQTTNFEALLVDFIFKENGKYILGVRLMQSKHNSPAGANRRREKRWSCSDLYYPTAMAANPAKYNDFIYFRVRDVSANGMQLVTSLRNKHIVAGMRFSCIMNFPMVSQLKLEFRVNNVRVGSENGREFLSLGVVFINPTQLLNQTIGQYVLQFGDADSISQIKEENLSVKTAGASIDFRYSRTKEDYEAVLELRRQAYVIAGKADSDIKKEELSDIFDSRSRIIMGIYQGKLVATCRLVFNQIEDEMEQEGYITWPKELPRRDEVVEVMRACTHPDFRGADLLPQMFRFIALTVVQSKRQYIVQSTTKDLCGLYEKIGFQATGHKFPLPALNNTIHHVYIANVPHAISGKGVHPLYWNFIWGDVAKFMTANDFIEVDPFRSIRMSILRMLGPLAELLNNFKKKPKRTELGSKKTNVVPLKGEDESVTKLVS